MAFARVFGTVEDMPAIPAPLDRDAIDAVLFDAMGVLYSAADDVGELLVPYLRSHGCVLLRDEIAQLYQECSLGKMSSADFWATAGATGASDEEYCRNHRLTEGVVAVLAELDATGVRLGCLSNDVREWSKLLRERFGLGEYLTDWFVSGDIGVRKPAPKRSPRSAIGWTWYRTGSSSSTTARRTSRPREPPDCRPCGTARLGCPQWTNYARSSDRGEARARLAPKTSRRQPSVAENQQQVLGQAGERGAGAVRPVEVVGP